MTYFHFIYYIKKILLALLDTGVKYISKYCRTRIFKICRQAALFQKTYKDHKSYEDYFENITNMNKRIPVKLPIVEETEFYADPNFFSVLSKIFW